MIMANRAAAAALIFAQVTGVGKNDLPRNDLVQAQPDAHTVLTDFQACAVNAIKSTLEEVAPTAKIQFKYNNGGVETVNKSDSLDGTIGIYPPDLSVEPPLSGQVDMIVSELEGLISTVYIDENADPLFIDSDHPLGSKITGEVTLKMNDCMITY